MPLDEQVGRLMKPLNMLRRYPEGSGAAYEGVSLAFEPAHRAHSEPDEQVRRLNCVDDQRRRTFKKGLNALVRTTTVVPQVIRRVHDAVPQSVAQDKCP